MEGARPVRAPRGTALTARSWQTEAPLRMLMNNLDPEVAERPDDLVVYGGTGRAARDWRSFDAIVRTLTDLKDDETLLVQSGKPVAVIRTHEWAPRVLIANSNLVGDWATWPEFRRLEKLGLTMYGQMTAGSWIYIGTQGILQGTYETFAAVAAKRFHGTLAGTLTVTGGCGGMGGAQPLAVTMNDGVCLIVDVDRSRLERRVQHRYLDEIADDLDDAIAGRASRPRPRAGRCRSGWSATAPRSTPNCCAAAWTSTSSPTRPPPTTRCLTCPKTSTRMTGTTTPPRSRPSSPSGPRPRWPGTSRPWSDSRTRVRRCSTTATRSATRRARAVSSARSRSRASSRRTSGPCSARARARSAGRRCPATRPTSRPPTRPCWNCSRTTTGCRSGSARRQDRVAFQGLPARICWLGYGERDKAGLAFNDLVASRKVGAPIVIGRDHLDCGSVASPYRETEAMADGSDAIADWPLLNALVNTASGATWGLVTAPRRRRRHGPLHPRRAGHRRRRHPAWRRSQQLERVLTTTTRAWGVIRHARRRRAMTRRDERSAACSSQEGGVRVPMREGGSLT